VWADGVRVATGPSLQTPNRPRALLSALSALPVLVGLLRSCAGVRQYRFSRSHTGLVFHTGG
jgi:hypothetical protein